MTPLRIIGLFREENRSYILVASVVMEGSDNEDGLGEILGILFRQYAKWAIPQTLVIVSMEGQITPVSSACCSDLPIPSIMEMFK